MTKTEITRTVMAVSERNQKETVTVTEKNIIEITWGERLLFILKKSLIHRETERLSHCAGTHAHTHTRQD